MMEQTDTGECHYHVILITALNHKIIAAISLSGPISRMTNMRIDLELIPSLRRATKLITEKINGFSVE